VGRAAILIPFPVVRVHQAENAQALVAVGAAVCIAQADATVPRLEQEIVALAHDGERRARMADAARQEGRPDAAREIAQDLLALARGARTAGRASHV
jgi:UDP-N-acetylglucosamine--N-acetylmuramyl-(pentapeptide) pyrophosphoryl-undecaprenol N-acetylglucosamine transferase